MFNDCIIIAGGSGTKLWPASRMEKPKQFLSISEKGGKCFFSAAVEQAFELIEEDGKILVIAGKAHVPQIIEACAELNAVQKKQIVVIPEPEAKNTAPAIACAAMYVDWVNGCERNIMVLTSDHIIQPMETFKTDACAAAAFAQSDKLAVFGIPPAGILTVTGYIETAKRLSAQHNIEKIRRLTEPEVYSVAAFREIQDPKTAEKCTASGRFFLNSGMYAFSSKFIISEYRRLARDVIRPFQQLFAPNEVSYTVKKGLRILANWTGLEKAYNQTKNISFENAVAQKCSQVVMVCAGFDWIDIGNWEEYSRLLGRTESEVYISGEKITEKNSGNFVDSDIPVAIAGVDDLIVVIRSGRDGTQPAALITKKGETHHVHSIVEKIKKSGRSELL
jgi:mannose-1-phosphate guanylyltransferase/mannose-1-phosphate guanylyltransferase/mannose-6-phosphate isomerase